MAGRAKGGLPSREREKNAPATPVGAGRCGGASPLSQSHGQIGGCGPVFGVQATIPRAREEKSAIDEWKPPTPGSRQLGIGSVSYDAGVPRALVIVDIQNDYFPGGANPLAEPEAAAAAARRVLERFRAGGECVFHVQHVWDAPDATFLRPGTDGVEIHPAVAPVEGERVIQKDAPNAFLRTPLERELRERDIDSLVVCGMMTSMCVDATVRAAADLGFAVTVVHDACAAPQLAFDGVEVPAPLVSAAFFGALADGYARVVAAEEITQR